MPQISTLTNIQASSRIARPVLSIAAIVLFLIAGTIIVYLTGGTAYVYPYLMLVPVLMAAAWLGITATVITAISATLLIGPYMPLDVDAGVAQTTQNWLLRMVAFVGLGLVTAILFERLRQENRARMVAARSDARTGLLNQVALEEDLARELRTSAKRNAAPAIMLIRVTDLAEALEAVGPDSADEIIGNLAARIRPSLINGSRLYRFSASEIAVLSAPADSEELVECCGRIHDVAETALHVRNVPIRLELVIGLAQTRDMPTDKRKPFEVFRRARMALFEAIGAQEDHCLYRPEFEQDRSASLQLITQLRPGLRNGEFELHFQPKLKLDPDSNIERITGAEGLIRWQRPDGMVAPGAFISKVERTRLINPLTRFVIEASIEFAHRHPDLVTSLNLSPRSLFDRRMIDHLIGALKECGLASGTIELEITESGLMRDPGSATRVMSQLREHGARISIDDFGTGHSSFAWLGELPVDGLKIDRAFIRNAEQDEELRALIRCMIEVGHALGLEVTGEGAETDAECEVLRSLGCNQLQGFVLARPMPEKQFDGWMTERLRPH